MIAALAAGLFLAAVAIFGVGLYSGYRLHGDRDQDRGLLPEVRPAAPPAGPEQWKAIRPFPGQWPLEITEASTDETGGWYRPLLRENGVQVDD